MNVKKPSFLIMSIKKQIDEIMDKYTSMGYVPVAIHIKPELYVDFVRDIDGRCYMNRPNRYRGARLIVGFSFLVNNERVENGVVFSYVFKDYGFYSVKQMFAHLEEDNIKRKEGDKKNE